jgi:hypothetical protein
MSNETLQPTQSYGQKLVGVRFNPSGLTEVDQMKQVFADAIDDIQEKMGEDQIAQSKRVLNELSLEKRLDHFIKQDIGKEAIKRLVDACMWTVKFYTAP